MRKSVVTLVAAIALAALAPAIASASPYIQAHRGGPLKTVHGELRPAFPENSLPAFRHAAKLGFVLEMDTRRTADGRVVIMHDASLKRTTNCTGLVSERTLAEIRSDCEIDIVGTDEISRHLGKRDDRRAEVPTMVQALRVAKRAGVGVNLEVNNYPTDPDYDPSTGFALAVAQGVEDSGFPPSDLILQSFLPGNLTPFQGDSYFDDSKTSFLSFQNVNGVAASIASSSGLRLHLAAVAGQRGADLRRSRARPAGRPVHLRREGRREGGDAGRRRCPDRQRPGDGTEGRQVGRAEGRIRCRGRHRRRRVRPLGPRIAPSRSSICSPTTAARGCSPSSTSRISPTSSATTRSAARSSA